MTNKTIQKEINSFRVTCWCEEVKRVSGKTCTELEREFGPETFKPDASNIVKHPRKWKKYEKGLHVPSPQLVDQVESRYPGAKKWLEHVIWKVVERPIISLQELYRLIYDLNDP